MRGGIRESGMIRALNRFVYAVVRRVDLCIWALRQRRGIGPVTLVSYIGHGTHERVFVTGRALADIRVRPAQPGDSTWRNLVNMFYRFHTHELPHVRVRARFRGLEQVVITDHEGHFDIYFDLPEPLPADIAWHEVALDLPDYADHPGARTTARVLVPPANAQFGVISDLDDTVIMTDISNKLNMMITTFTNNVHTRTTAPGVPAFFHALQAGNSPTHNPIFYVSTAPWNLFDMLQDFFALSGIPTGPMFMINLGLTPKQFLRPSGRVHKVSHSSALLDTYPDLPFILIGDSGEHDPAIYLDVLRRYPGRILAMYVHAVRPRHVKALNALVEEARDLGVDLLLINDMRAAAQHAAAHGWIAPEAVAAVEAEVETEAEVQRQAQRAP